MTFVLVDHDDNSSVAGSEATVGELDSVVDLPLPLVPCGGGGHYRPAAAAAGASALHWVPFATAVSAVRPLLGASHEDLRLRAHELSRSLSAAFFFGGAVGAFPGGGVRFPEGDLYVCTDLHPLGPALRQAQRALTQVAVKEAGHGACDHFYDQVGHVMWLLVGDAPDGRGPVVLDREKFEADFKLEWVDSVE